MDIIKRNLFRLIRSGALSKFEAIEPMSVFKWNRLLQMSTAQNVTSIVLKGIKNNQYENNIDVPISIINQLTTAIATDDATPLALTLSNRLLNHRLQKIKNAERHAIDTSANTLELLDIILNNVSEILSNGISLRRIIDLGKYLRTNGDKVDFVKLDTWLVKLHLKRMAQLEGSILIKIFNFEQNEIPFVTRIEPMAEQLTLRTINHTAIDTAKEWHFRQSKTGFVRNNSAVLRRNLRRSMRYVNYAPIETISNFIGNFARSLSEIEE